MSPLPSNGTPSGTGQYMLPQSLWVHMYMVHVVLRRHCFFGVLHSKNMVLGVFLPPLLQVSLSLERQFIGDIPFRAGMMSGCGCGSLNLFPSSAGGSFSDDG